MARMTPFHLQEALKNESTSTDDTLLVQTQSGKLHNVTAFEITYPQGLRGPKTIVLHAQKVQLP